MATNNTPTSSTGTDEWSFDQDGYLYNRNSRIKFIEIVKNNTNGITLMDNTPVPIHVGTANDAIKLNGVSGSQYITTQNIGQYIPRATQPTVTMATTVNENKTITGTINNYDANASYNISVDKGKVSTVSSIGTFTYTAPSISNKTNTTAKVTISASTVGYVKSNNTVIDVTIVYVAIQFDQATSNTMLGDNAYLEEDLINSGSNAISSADNAVYVENEIIQNSNQSDWVLASGNELNYLPKKLTVNQSGTVASGTNKGKNYVGIAELHTNIVPGDQLVNISSNNAVDMVDVLEVKDVPIDVFQVNKLKTPNTGSTDEFGEATSLSADGLICIVGAYGTSSYTGKAYTFTRATTSDAWIEQNSFAASGLGSNDQFGRDVSLSPDGLICIVGAYGVSSSTGKVYTFTRATTSDTWTEQNSFVSSSSVSGDGFGDGVDISPDGLICIVGASGVSSYTGRAYTFTRATTSDAWTEQNSFAASGLGSNDYFGSSVALSANGLICLVGATGNLGHMYTFIRSSITDNWVESAFTISQITSGPNTTGSNFARRIGITGNGLTCIVGAPSYQNKGAAHIYTRSSTDLPWEHVKLITDPANTTYDNFGHGSSISSDGKTIIVGTWDNTSNTYTSNTATTNMIYTFNLDLEHTEIVHNSTTPITNLYQGDVNLALSLNNKLAMDSIGQDINITLDKSYNGSGTKIRVLDKISKSTILNVDNVIKPIVSVSPNDVAVDPTVYGGTKSITKISSTTTEFIGKVNINTIDVKTDDIVVMDTTSTSITSVTKVIELGAVTQLNSFQSTGVTGTDGFGIGTSISSDGLICIVGAQRVSSNTGRAYTFTRATTSDAWTEQNSFVSSSSVAGDYFGDSVALSPDGLICIVGAWGVSSKTGRAYTFTRATTSDAWTEQNSFVSSSAVAGDYFGVGVSMSADGLICMVGAQGVSSNTGKVYTFTRATTSDAWTEQNSFVSSSSISNDEFGDIVSISADGLICIVGAQGVSSSTGKAYTFTRATTSDAWTEQNSFVSSSSVSGDLFGSYMSLSANGLICLVGAWEASSGQGAAYIFKRATISDTWTQVHEITDPGATANDNFGLGCSITQDGTIALIGSYGENGSTTTANKVYTFNLDIYDKYTLGFSALSTAPSTCYINNRFPKIVDISNHGLTTDPTFACIPYIADTVVSNSTTTSATATYPNKKNLIVVGTKVLIDNTNVVDVLTVPNKVSTNVILNTTPVEINSFQSTGVTGTDNFGVSTSISADGLICIVGASNVSSGTGKAYTFTRATTSDTWTEQNSFAASGLGSNDYFGSSIALSADGLICIVGAWGVSSNTGKVYTFTRATTSDTWTEQNSFVNSNSVAGGSFGAGVSLSPNGLICIVGANGTPSIAGKAYTFTRATTSDTWTEQNSFVSSSNAGGDYFATYISLSADGLICIVGAQGVSSSTGKAYTFTRTTTSDAWTEQNSFAASGLGSNSYFGRTLGMSGNGLVCIVGAYGVSSSQGAAYIFTRATTSDTWTQVHEITDPGATANDMFGHGCSITQDGTIALVGSYGGNHSTTTGNKVYTFDIAHVDSSYDITFAAQSTAPTAIQVLDTAFRLAPTGTTFDGTKFIKKFANYSKTGRAISHKVSLTDTDTKILAPITTQLST